MASTWGSLRRRVLTPDVSATSLAVRGFHEKNAEARDLLETIGRSFLQGFGYAAECRAVDEAAANLERVPERFRGFAYEGAAMGFAVRDALPLGRSDQGWRFLAGPAKHHSYMLYIGAGWAMARVPRRIWRKLELGNPLLRWLMLDGYGFHQAYFKTAKYVDGQYQEPASFPWPAHDATWYANHVIDQGIGRALWFIHGTDPHRVADAIHKFPAHRHPDLFSGAGLAATYAGGVTEDELRDLYTLSGACAPNVAQGSAFGASCRVEAGNAEEHTALAVRVLCGMTVEEAVDLCVRTRPAATPETPGFPGIPSYEVWRRRVASVFGAEVPV
jgi:enediyne biosynthesis protein E3